MCQLFMRSSLGIESDPSGDFSQVPAIASKIDPATDVVLEFGDNVHIISAEAFGSAYDQLAAAVEGTRPSLCKHLLARSCD